jgi:Fe2+ or Zn2+ uptake regulation protein
MKKTRSTKQKKTLELELEKINKFFSAEEFHDKIKQHQKDISIATIYRFLNEQKKEGKIYSYLCDRTFIYSKEKKSHCHFICESTGKTIHFEIDSLDFLKNKVPGSITSIQLEVKGVCDDCSVISKKKNKK